MKLVTETKTKNYELTYLIPGGYTESELKKVQEEVQALVKKHKGTIVSEDAWGKKLMAYDIRKGGKIHTEASYFHLVIELQAEKTPLFEKELYLNETIIRHLLVVAKEDKVSEEKKEVEVKEEEKK